MRTSLKERCGRTSPGTSGHKGGTLPLQTPFNPRRGRHSRQSAPCALTRLREAGSEAVGRGTREGTHSISCPVPSRSRCVSGAQCPLPRGPSPAPGPVPSESALPAPVTWLVTDAACPIPCRLLAGRLCPCPRLWGLSSPSTLVGTGWIGHPGLRSCRPLRAPPASSPRLRHRGTTALRASPSASLRVEGPVCAPAPQQDPQGGLAAPRRPPYSRVLHCGSERGVRLCRVRVCTLTAAPCPRQGPGRRGGARHVLHERMHVRWFRQKRARRLSPRGGPGRGRELCEVQVVTRRGRGPPVRSARGRRGGAGGELSAVNPGSSWDALQFSPLASPYLQDASVP